MFALEECADIQDEIRESGWTRREHRMTLGRLMHPERSREFLSVLFRWPANARVVCFVLFLRSTELVYFRGQ